jgi:hypothetical protein
VHPEASVAESHLKSVLRPSLPPSPQSQKPLTICQWLLCYWFDGGWVVMVGSVPKRNIRSDLLRVRSRAALGMGAWRSGLDLLTGNAQAIVITGSSFRAHGPSRPRKEVASKSTAA